MAIGATVANCVTSVSGERNLDTVNGLKPVVGGKPVDCKEAVDKIIRIKNRLVDVLIFEVTSQD
jgi:hypothetical protein